MKLAIFCYVDRKSAEISGMVSSGLYVKELLCNKSVFQRNGDWPCGATGTGQVP